MSRIEIAREDHGKQDALARAVDRASRKRAIEIAVAAERERIAAFVESMDDGPITTKAVKSYIAAEIRTRG